MPDGRLGIGFIGAGFVARFHIQSLVGVRNADVAAIMGPTPERAESAAKLARDLGVGDPKTYSSIAGMARDPAVDAVWVCAPNDVRVAVVEELVAAVSAGARLVGVACEKPLARNVAEARRMLELVGRTSLLHGYLENQVFAPSLTRGKEIIWRRAAAIAGRPYLARASEEHSGPHMPWFWSGARQGGGVLNDMLCHSFEAARFLLTAPGEPRSSVTVEEVNAQIASLEVVGCLHTPVSCAARWASTTRWRRPKTSPVPPSRSPPAAGRLLSRPRRPGTSLGPACACAWSCSAPSTRCR